MIVSLCMIIFLNRFGELLWIFLGSGLKPLDTLVSIVKLSILADQEERSHRSLSGSITKERIFIIFLGCVGICRVLWYF